VLTGCLSPRQTDTWPSKKAKKQCLDPRPRARSLPCPPLLHTISYQNICLGPPPPRSSPIQLTYSTIRNSIRSVVGGALCPTARMSGMTPHSRYGGLSAWRGVARPPFWGRCAHCSLCTPVYTCLYTRVCLYVGVCGLICLYMDLISVVGLVLFVVWHCLFVPVS